MSKKPSDKKEEDELKKEEHAKLQDLHVVQKKQRVGEHEDLSPMRLFESDEDSSQSSPVHVESRSSEAASLELFLKQPKSEPQIEGKKTARLTVTDFPRIDGLT